MPAPLVVAGAVLLCAATAVPPMARTLVFPPYGHSYGIRKATGAHLFMFFGPSTSFDNPQGVTAVKMVSRDDPSTSKDDDELTVYGVNAGRHELIYNTSMWTLGRFGRQGSGNGEFFHPRGIVAEPWGNVFVADSGNNRVVHLFNERRTVEWVRAYSAPLKEDNGFRGPQQIALDEQCRIYVTDTGNRRIVVFDTAGTYSRVLTGGERPFEGGPTMLAIADGTHRYSHYRSERVLFCADRNGRRLWKIALDGKVLKQVSMPGHYRAGYAATDYYHNLWVSDITNHCILKFSRNLELLDVFGSYGKGDNEFNEPRGIAIWKRFGQTFIAERQGAQYYWIGTDLRNPRLELLGDATLRLRGTVTEYSYVSLFMVEGSDTSAIALRQFFSAGNVDRSFAIPPALLPITGKSVLVRVEPTYSSYTYFEQMHPVPVTYVKEGPRETDRSRD